MNIYDQIVMIILKNFLKRSRDIFSCVANHTENFGEVGKTDRINLHYQSQLESTYSYLRAEIYLNRS
ncbi:hypothetical protein BpHYR1_014336 [Brachionus plicatilis]|uniref:Uncharacterized protein n=1 Tax=Brachionus plicatilis TaxID=10195 RepID=A0A3M7Q7G0_BRAPC|nr:hypothetical protein BpHYR1_014336 [Brachionus plicatilis]